MPSSPNVCAAAPAAVPASPPSSPHRLAASRGLRSPLLVLQAHWQVPAHRRYLEAASFTWQR